MRKQVVEDGEVRQASFCNIPSFIYIGDTKQVMMPVRSGSGSIHLMWPSVTRSL